VPELPDIVVYIEALEQRIQDQTLERISLASPFLLRTALPPITSAEGRKVVELRRLGKRICVGLEGELWLVLHLMIAGRLHWSLLSDSGGKAQTAKTAKPKLSRSPKNPGLAAFQFDTGTLSLTEAGSQRRASLHLVVGESGLQQLDPGGLEIFETDLEGFAKRLTAANHTLKRALTDPRLFSGIGNAYSDEILHKARLSPFKLTKQLTRDEIRRILAATRETLQEWTTRLQKEAGDEFPEKVTAFREGMAVHGRFGKPCPQCGTPVQRIVHGEHEVNYCPTCQTEGRLLADRSLSRLLKDDWPRTLDELQRRRERLRQPG